MEITTKGNDVFGNDYEVEGQISIFDIYEQDYQSPMIAVSKVFAAAIKQMNLKEWKTFVYGLTQIKWTEQNRNVIRLDKWKLVEILGINSDADHVSEHLRRDIGKLPIHSFIEITDKDKGIWENGNFIERIGCYKEYVRLVFTPYYMPLFQELNKDRSYITLWAEDLFQMTSERSILFYEDLRLHSDTTKVNTRTFGVKDLKKMFNIPKDGKGSYMRKDGHFDRPAFEAKVIGPLCDDIEKCAMINLIVQEDGKPYRKVKYHGRVIGYEFCWTVSNHPAVATAEEVQHIQERVDKDPQVLKVAKDIVTGDKKKKSSTPKKDPEQDYDALVKELMNLDS